MLPCTPSHRPVPLAFIQASRSAAGASPPSGPAHARRGRHSASMRLACASLLAALLAGSAAAYRDPAMPSPLAVPRNGSRIANMNFGTMFQSERCAVAAPRTRSPPPAGARQTSLAALPLHEHCLCARSSHLCVLLTPHNETHRLEHRCQRGAGLCGQGHV